MARQQLSCQVQLNILCDPLPKSVLIDGAEYAVRYSAADMIKLSLIGDEEYPEMSEDEAYSLKLLKQMEMFYIRQPNNLQEAVEKMALFYLGLVGVDAGGDAGQKENGGRKNFCYGHDAQMIYAAFAQQYNIRDFRGLHWYEFKSLFEGLTDDCMLVKIMQFRSMKIHSKMSDEDKKYYRKMKRIHALPDKRTQEQKDSANDSFMMSLFNMA